MKKRIICFLILLSLTLPALALAHPTTTQTQTPDNTAMLTLSTDTTYYLRENIGLAEIASTPTARTITLLWLPLPPAIQPAQLTSAHLWLRIADGDATALRVGLVRDGWTMNNTTYDDIANSIVTSAPVGHYPGTPQPAGDGWYTLDITDFARAWLLGVYDANGVALYTDAADPIHVYTPFGEDTGSTPMLTVTYESPETSQRYGRFAFTQQEDGNCLAYALRDLDGIYLDALVTDMVAFQAAYDEDGEAGALAYFWAAVQGYIGAHREALGIAAVRELDAWDAPIDVEREYRVALRIGLREYDGVPGVQVDGDDFDFHLRAQLADGSWAEKVPGDAARVTPGSNAGLPPAGYPWDQSFLWGYQKWADVYGSDAVYFAVEKPTDGFTRHAE